MAVRTKGNWSVELNVQDYLLNSIPELTELAMERASLKIAGDIVDLASELAPYDDNPNRPTWKSTHLEDDGMVTNEQGIIGVSFGSNLVEPRAALQEFGPEKYNVRFEAQPFLRPAAAVYAPLLSQEVYRQLAQLSRTAGTTSKTSNVGAKIRTLFGKVKSIFRRK